MISKNNLELISKYFKFKNEKIIPYKEAATDLREQLGVFESIFIILQPKSIVKFMMQGTNNNGKDVKSGDFKQSTTQTVGGGDKEK